MRERKGVHFVAFGVLFVEGADIEGVGGVDFAARWNQRRRILLHVDLLPINADEEWVLFDFVGPATTDEQ